MKKLTLVFTFSILITLYIFSPFFTNEYYVKSFDVIDHYSYLPILKNESSFGNDNYASFFIHDYVYSKLFSYLVIFFNIPFAYIYNILIPILCSLIATYSFYKIGKHYFGSKGGFFSGIIGSILIWVNDFSSQSVPHSIVLSMTYLFFYYFISKNLNGQRTILILTAFLYPPPLAILFPFYVLTEIQIKNQKSILNSSFLFIITSIIVLSTFNITLDRIHQNDAIEMEEFSQEGTLPTFFESPLKAIFSNNDQIGTGIKLFYKNNFTMADSPYLLLIILFLIFNKKIRRLNWIMPWGLTLYLVSYFYIFDILSYTPSRYIHFSIMPYISLSFILGLYWITTKSKKIKNINIYLKTIICAILIIIIFSSSLKPTGSVCPNTDLYKEIIKLPENSKIAGTIYPNYLNCIPLHTKKSVITSEAITRSVTYIKSDQKEKNMDIINAYYSNSPQDIENICNSYNITHIIISNSSFNPNTFIVKDEYETFEPYYSYIRSNLNKNSYLKLQLGSSNSPLLDSEFKIYYCGIPIKI